MWKTGLIVVLIAIVSVFSVQNAPSVTVAALFWKVETPLTLVIVVAMLIGMLTGGLIAYRPQTKFKENGMQSNAAKVEERSAG